MAARDLLDSHTRQLNGVHQQHNQLQARIEKLEQAVLELAQAHLKLGGAERAGPPAATSPRRRDTPPQGVLSRPLNTSKSDSDAE